MADLGKQLNHCNTCGGDRNHLLINKVKKYGDQELSEGCSISWGNIYSVLECAGCETIKVLHETWFSEDTDGTGQPIIRKTYYPPSIYRPLPNWFPSLDKDWHVTKLIEEIFAALQNDATSLSAMGIRAAIETIMIDKVGDKGNFKANLKEFQEQRYISLPQLKLLEAALELGHASIHRAFIPDKEHIEVSLDILENLLNVLYVLEGQASAAALAIPKRSPRK
ncbi:MAG: DUF4145 domain-containing protein [Methylophilaceae bacterium]